MASSARSRTRGEAWTRGSTNRWSPPASNDHWTSSTISSRSFEQVDEADQPHVLARHIHQTVLRSLQAVSGEGAEARPGKPSARPAGRPRWPRSRPSATAAGAHECRQVTRSHSEIDGATQDSPVRCGSSRPIRLMSRPSVSELRSELESADEVDLLCAFVKWHGLRVLEPELRRLKERGAPFRVITTTYMGATERAALDRLVREFGAEVKIQYDAARTRLHAKAWCFGATPASTRPTSARRTCLGPPCSTAWSGTCACPAWHAEPDREVHGHVRHLLERPPLRDSTTPSGTATGSTTHSPKPRGVASTTASPSRCRGWKFVPIPTSKRCWRRSTSSERCTTVTATLLWLPPEQGRR